MLMSVSRERGAGNGSCRSCVSSGRKGGFVLRVSCCCANRGDRWVVRRTAQSLGTLQGMLSQNQPGTGSGTSWPLEQGALGRLRLCAGHILLRGALQGLDWGSCVQRERP